MSEVILTAEIFLNDFPEFENVDTAIITRYINQAEIFIDPLNNGYITYQQRLLMLELLTAHIITTMQNSEGTTSTSMTTTVKGFLSSAHIHDVSVNMATPIISDNLEYWLASSQYGLQLLALLNSFPNISYHGGSCVRVL